MTQYAHVLAAIRAMPEDRLASGTVTAHAAVSSFRSCCPASETAQQTFCVAESIACAEYSYLHFISFAAAKNDMALHPRPFCSIEIVFRRRHGRNNIIQLRVQYVMAQVADAAFFSCADEFYRTHQLVQIPTSKDPRQGNGYGIGGLINEVCSRCNPRS